MVLISQGVCRKSTPGPYLFDTPPDVRIALLAAEQEGVVSTAQLYAAGLNQAAIQVRVRNGHLHRIHNGVYAVGHTAISLNGRFMAAVLACGEPSALSHYSAGTVEGYLTWDDNRYPEVKVLGL